MPESEEERAIRAVLAALGRKAARLATEVKERLPRSDEWVMPIEELPPFLSEQKRD